MADCYEVWNRLRDDVESYYKDTSREWQPLSRQKEFKSIKNMVIREAENIRLGVVTFEDEQMMDEPWEEEKAVPSFQSRWQMAEVYREAKAVLCDDDAGFTLRTYTHATRQMQDDAAAKMGSFMAQVM